MGIPWGKWGFPREIPGLSIGIVCVCVETQKYNVVSLQTCWFTTVGKGPWVLGIRWGFVLILGI